jgi:hypothetical protein
MTTLWLAWHVTYFKMNAKMCKANHEILFVAEKVIRTPTIKFNVANVLRLPRFISLSDISKK